MTLLHPAIFLTIGFPISLLPPDSFDGGNNSSDPALCNAPKDPQPDYPRAWRSEPRSPACAMEMEDVSLEVAEKDTAAEIAAEAAVSDPANHRPPPKHPGTPNPRKTCQPCRLRKVRCLQGEGTSCANCDRLGFTCSFQAASPQGDGDNGSASSMTLPRRRVRLACSNCHSRKARCSGEMPKCKRCQSQGIECIYRPTKRSGTLTTPAPGQAGDSEHESVSSEPPEKRRHVHNDSNASQGDYATTNRASTHVPWSVNHDTSVLNLPNLPPTCFAAL